MATDPDKWKRVMVGFVTVILRTPSASDYVRERSRQMERDGVAWPVAIFQAMAEYVAGNPINPDSAAEWTYCRICGESVRIFKGRGGWPDMWHCPNCNRTGILKETGVIESERASWLYD